MSDSPASCGPVRTANRVVGFKVSDSSVSPTSVICGDDHLTTIDSPRSLIAAALKAEHFKPLPRLTIRPRAKLTPLSALKKSKSHADLGMRIIHSTDGSEPATPGSRASTSSTPMKIPSAILRVHTCPMDLSELSQTLMATRHTRRSSNVSDSSVVKDLFDANQQQQQAATLVSALAEAIRKSNIDEDQDDDQLFDNERGVESDDNTSHIYLC